MFELTPQMIMMVLIGMMFCSTIHDFYLPDLLVKLKDAYKIGLIVSGFTWTCIISIPLLLHINYCGWSYSEKNFLIMFVTTWIVHIIVDDFSRIRNKFGVAVTQLTRFIQIIILWLVYFEEVG